MNAKMRVAGVAFLVLVVGMVSWFVFQPRHRQPREDGRQAVTKNRQTEQDSGTGADAGYVLRGGARQKVSDDQPSKPSTEPKTATASASGHSYGRLPAIRPDANPQVKAVVETIRQKKHVERLSALGVPSPFDAKTYQADKAAYLSLVEVGRVFQTAQPGPGVQRLAPLSPRFQEVAQGKSVVLQVRAPAGAPVSFTSFDCGQFDNELSAITVEANDDGIAEARFTTTTGTVEDIHILAGSPMASGQIQFIVNVQWPRNVAAASSSGDAT